MKKLLTVFIAVILFTGFNYAQKDMAVGAGVIVGLPMGGFGDLAGTGIGATGIFEMEFMPQLVGIGQIGYISWGGKDFGYYSYGYSAIPLLVGVKYFFVPKIPFYGTASLGFEFLNANASYTGPYGFNFAASGSSTEFAFVFGAGYEVPVSPKFDLDFTATMNIVSDANYIGLRAGGKLALQ